MNIDWVKKLMRKRQAGKVPPPANETSTTPTNEAVLAEMHEMRGELARLKVNDPKFIAAVNYIMDKDQVEGLKTIIERSIGAVDHAVPYVLNSDTFNEFLANAGLEVVIDEAVQHNSQYCPLMLDGGSFGISVHNNPLHYDLVVFVVASNHVIYMNKAAHWHFDSSYGKLKQELLSY